MSTLDSIASKKANNYEPYWRDLSFYKRRFGGLESSSMNGGVCDSDSMENGDTVSAEALDESDKVKK